MIPKNKKRITITIPTELLENLKEIQRDYKEPTISTLIAMYTDWYLVNMFDRNYKYTVKENEEIEEMINDRKQK